MFAYVDPNVKEELLRDGKLIELDAHGHASDASKEPPFLSMVGPIPLPVGACTDGNPFQWYAWVKHADLNRIDQVVQQVRRDGPRMIYPLVSDYMMVNSILIYGDFADAASPLVRVHSNCLTGDVFGSLRCDCGPQLQTAVQRIRQEGVGALVYMAGHEGRGIGLWAKAITYLLQDAGHDTYQANERLGLPADSRDFRDAGLVVRFFRGKRNGIRLMGNNPMKREAMESVGMRVDAQEPLVTGVNCHNVRYLASKREKGHIIPAEALSLEPAATPPTR
ncbi:MAG: GTP cyclohydrolase II [Polyangiaceae bacterium]|nr:GTP cyclohydrolase II [Polyangiaceae bacterium]